MSENLTNDPLVSVTRQDMDVIIESRVRRNLGRMYPKTNPEVANLGLSRLWYIAEFMIMARESKVSGRPDDESKWKQKAADVAFHTIADNHKDFEFYSGATHDELLSGIDRLNAFAEKVRNSMRGEHEAESPPSAMIKILSKIRHFNRKHKRNPSRTELNDSGERWEDIKEVCDALEGIGSTHTRIILTPSGEGNGNVNITTEEIGATLHLNRPKRGRKPKP